MAIKIAMPAKRTGPRVRKTVEACEHDLGLMEQAKGTQHEWGYTAVKRLVTDFESFGAKVDIIKG